MAITAAKLAGSAFTQGFCKLDANKVFQALVFSLKRKIA
ncbi:hypothetical protein ALT717_10276 [Alteromonas macleodii]